LTIELQRGCRSPRVWGRLGQSCGVVGARARHRH
jgi:hypothetical protein